jgi:hypothetical protein
VECLSELDQNANRKTVRYVFIQQEPAILSSGLIGHTNPSAALSALRFNMGT